MADKRPLRKRIKYTLLYYILKFTLWFAGKIPRKSMMSFLSKGSRFVGSLRKREISIIENNLIYIYGDKYTPKQRREFALKVFENIGRIYTDTIQYASIKGVEGFREIVDVPSWDHLNTAFESGRGVILLITHTASFDVAAKYMFAEGYDFLVGGAPLHDPKLNKLMVENRMLKGGQFLSRGESRANTIKMLRQLKNGNGVMLLIDQDTNGAKSVFVNSLGKPAATPVGVTVMAHKSNALVLPVGMQMLENGNHQLTFDEPIDLLVTGNEEEDLLRNTQILSDASDKIISRAPEQWMWFHERWRRKPEDYPEQTII